MSTRIFRIFAIYLAGFFAAKAQETEQAARWWENLEVGTRALHIWLAEDTRKGTLNPFADPSRPTSYSGRFIGTISELEVDQNYMPTRIYAQYFFHKHFGVGLSYDEMDIDTRDEDGSDGYINLYGPIVYAIGRMKVEERISPFAELGIGLFSTEFEADESWRRAGPFGRRVMDIDDPLAAVVGLGIDISLSENFSLNVYTRAILNATVDAKAYYSKNADEPFAFGEFPLDSYGIGLGILYAF
ncbi:MAG: hypothetical protein NZ740_08770 [Kiritimatiellae bacterium]|nr:hypothetical protein [Kiritimatiellia bacterium]MDW8459184.1 hypothetical protein [Verrucomicrobiota bacterium]